MLQKQHSFVVLLFLSLLTSAAVGQVSSADYERAANLRTKYRGLTVNQPESPRWIKSSGQLLYRTSVAGGHAFVLVDPKTATKKPAFDHEKVAAALSKASGESITATTLPFERSRITGNGESITFPLQEARWTCDVVKYECKNAGALRPYEFRYGDYEDEGQRDRFRSEAVPSPDGKWEAFIQNYNVFIRAKGSREPSPLSFDGTESNSFDRRSIRWSPDSKRLAAYRVRQGFHRKINYVESSPQDQLQPKFSSIEYEKPGDILDLEQPVLFDVESKMQIDIDNALFPNPFSLSPIEWRKDGRAFTFEYNQRGHQLYRIVEVDAKTGAARGVITETSKTFIDYPRLIPNQTDTGKTYRYDVKDGAEVVWMSERDGWAHLYLFDGVTGKLKNQITKGNWVVRAVDRVDEEKRQIWFQASGMYPGKDPYFTHAFRINFDGTGLTKLTDNPDANHQISYSPDGKYFVDLWSRVDLAPVMQLRDAEKGSVVMDVERADISKLLAAGWQAPEVFSAIGRDGKTDIWGIISRPANFDPNKKYPVIEAIYAGPQGSFVPKSFNTLVEPLTELGFVVVHIDGMGTNNRSKAFHDVAWHNLKDGGFEDRILWHKAVAAKYPWYDISRVGIYGTSAGGQNALAALLFHPEFYHAGVANCGSHDNRIDKIWWNELWMGWPIGPHYAASSNVDNAYRLQGKLMLVVGEMDTNVDPAATFQVVNALIKANKQFDLVVVPGGGHGAGGAWGQRALQDFFVHNLLGMDPPNWNRELQRAVAVGK
ncbi:MAG TPA: DPP IV N-terminal domain-containing protein [Terriglobales bacterium]|nr:DPP IV N-terminal domain-containing protein [Terriglobales bacterium]